MANTISVPRAGSLPVPRPGETWERRRADSVAAPRTVTAIETGEEGILLVSFSMPIDEEIRQITLPQWHRWVHVHQAALLANAEIAGPGAGDALIVIDVQPTFMPGGELPVPEGYAVIPPINRLLDAGFACAVATQDWHPAGHISFASSHPGKQPYDVISLDYGAQTLWPDHAIQGSHGASLHPALKTDRLDLVLRKGFRPRIDSYSAFRENDRETRTGLAAYLAERNISRVFLCGLALDFCVAWSAEDALAAGLETLIVEDACRGIGLPDGDETTLSTTKARLSRAGIVFTETNAVLAALTRAPAQEPRVLA